VVILTQVDAPESTGLHVKMGSKVELMQAGIGHVILAHQSEDLRRYALEEWARETQRKKPAELDAHLAKIRRRGHETCASFQVKGVVNISFPVFGARGEAVAGLTVPYVKRLEDKIGVPDVVRALRIASRELSEAWVRTRLIPGPGAVRAGSAYHWEYHQKPTRAKDQELSHA
jgi:DNA-binding IclR family transcriptional regulator